MKRVIAAIVGTVAGVVALLSFKTSSPQANTGPLPAAGSDGSVDSSGVAPATPSTSTTSTTPTTSTAPSTASSSSAARTYAGRSVTTRYGIVQVGITVAAGRITGVRFLQLQAFDRRSAEINSGAAPELLQETMSAQSAHIDTVSGASYTSAGYVQSLQSALDAARVS